MVLSYCSGTARHPIQTLPKFGRNCKQVGLDGVLPNMAVAASNRTGRAKGRVSASGGSLLLYRSPTPRPQMSARSDELVLSLICTQGEYRTPDGKLDAVGARPNTENLSCCSWCRLATSGPNLARRLWTLESGWRIGAFCAGRATVLARRLQQRHASQCIVKRCKAWCLVHVILLYWRTVVRNRPTNPVEGMAAGVLVLVLSRKKIRRVSKEEKVYIF